jgi:hypothetical protein
VSRIADYPFLVVGIAVHSVDIAVHSYSYSVGFHSCSADIAGSYSDHIAVVGRMEMTSRYGVQNAFNHNSIYSTKEAIELILKVLHSVVPKTHKATHTKITS